jgi:16S rRNA processing protein RimM
VILTLAGVASRTAAESLRKRRVFASEEDLPEPAPGEYFLSDLIGLDVFDTDSLRIGRVEDVFDMPGQDVLVIRTNDGREAMIPAVSEFLKDVDLESGRLVVSLIEGLL